MSTLSGYYLIGPWRRFPTRIFSKGPAYQLLGTFTVDPSTNIITTTVPHLQIPAEVVQFSSTGILPAPLDDNGIYRVLTDSLGASTLKVASNIGWNPPPESPPINITNSGSGIHYFWYRPFEIQQTFTPGNINISTDVITNNTRPHLLRVSARVQFTPQGASILPAPLVANTDYYIPAGGLTDFAFKLAIGGSAGPIVDLTTQGTGIYNFWVIGPLCSVMQTPIGDFGVSSDEHYWAWAQEVNIIGGGGGDAAGGGEPLTIELPRPTIRTRDPELASILRRARRAARTIEEISIVGASGDSESGFSL